MEKQNADKSKNLIGKLTSLKIYKRIMSLAAPEWKTLTIGMFFLIFASGAGLIFPKIARQVIDGATSKGLGAVDSAAMWMLVIFLIQGFSSGMRYFLFSLAGHRIVTNLRSQTFRQVMAQEVGFFDERKTGELLSRLSNDASTVQSAVSVNISMLLRGLATVIGGIVLLIMSSPILALLMLAIVPPVSLGAVFFGRKIRTLSKRFQDALAEASEVAEETLSGVRTVRSFARENDESARYESAIFRALAVMKTNLKFSAMFQAAITFFGYSAIALVLWYGGRLVVQGEMTTGLLTEFILYTFMVAFSLTMLGGLWADFMRAAGAAERIFEIMDRTTEIPNDEGERPTTMAGSIDFKNVSFAYPTRPDISALSEVTFSIKPGEVVALVGPSGGGKSTIAALIPRFYDPTSGNILIDGKSVKDLSPSWLREHVGSVPQDPMLFSCSISDNIGYGSHTDHSMESIKEAARHANAYDFVNQFPDQFDTRVGERGVQLSGGQRQRVAIARAVLKDPRILILDEATSALDAESEHLVKQALDRLMKNRTTLIIAHRLSTVKDADRVIVLDKGRIVETGTHQELVNSEDGLYRKLVERQFVLEPGH